ncbi:mRNA export factor Gle1 [Anopheles aquasalis]|uniref:mRNA export factor Gle1 n=1 Tax=Anopheles aquasalis TaxID=42839 RepID=UPI00215B1F78|nr:mRNA export factor Gle1 [Anopheles aquasalis]
MGSTSDLNLDDLLSGFESMKISVLRNAAKLSPHIKGRTLGPDCPDLSKLHISTDSNEAGKENDPNVSNEVPSGSKTGAETGPEEPTNKKTPPAKIRPPHLDVTTDCETVTSKLHQQELERQRIATVRKSLAERQSKIRQADEQREALLKQTILEAEQNVARKQQEADRRLLSAIQEQEKQAQEAAARRQAEIDEENRRVTDIAAQFKRRQEELRKKHQLIETIRHHNGQFRAGTEAFTKALTTIGVQHATKFTNQKKTVRGLQKDFEQLLQTINANHEVNQAEVDLAGEYCKQLDQANREVTEIVAQIESAQKQQEQLEQQRNQEQQAAAAAAAATATSQEAANQQPTVQELKPADSTDGAAVLPAVVGAPTATAPGIPDNEPFFQPVSPECLQFYTEVKSFYEQHQTAVKQLMDDPSMKTYRFNCQKAINIPVNAISGVNREHFIDKYNKLAALLSGQNVKVGDATVSINGHPLGRTYCTMLLAKKFVSQADTGISSNASAAFPIAAIVVALWQRFPEFGRFFLAYLHRECPYMVPYYLPQLEGQSQEEFLKTLGYRFVDGVLEKQDQYLKRMSGLARLYSAVIVTIPRRDDPTPHPHGLEYGWRWLTNILNRFPQPDICATLICEFLQTAGADLHAAYGKQFLKVLRVLQGDYLTALNKIDTGGPKARLEGLIAQILTEGKIVRPEGITMNFW